MSKKSALRSNNNKDILKYIKETICDNILSQIGIGIIITDEKGKCIYINNIIP